MSQKEKKQIMQLFTREFKNKEAKRNERENTKRN